MIIIGKESFMKEMKGSSRIWLRYLLTPKNGEEVLIHYIQWLIVLVP